jgi:hypothetical protein
VHADRKPQALLRAVRALCEKMLIAASRVAVTCPRSHRVASALLALAPLAAACAHQSSTENGATGAATASKTSPPAENAGPFPLPIPTCTPEPPAARPSDPAHRFQALAMGKFFLCGLRETGHAVCWPPLTNANQPVATPDDEFIQITAGDFFACGLRRDGTARCWGDDNGGATRAATGAGDRFRQIAASEMGVFALRTDGTLASWGSGAAPAAFSACTNCRLVTKRELDGRYVAIAQGAAHQCALASDGKIACWGGNPEPGESIEAPPGAYVAVAASLRGSCGLRKDGTVGCSKGSELVDQTSRFVAIAGGRYGGFCGVAEGGAVTCWGNGRDDRGRPVSSVTPRLRAGQRASEVVSGTGVCAIVDGVPRCWGHGDTLMTPFVDARAVAMGPGPRCVIARDCRRRCDDDPFFPEAPLTDADVEGLEATALAEYGPPVALSSNAGRGADGCRLHGKGILACGSTLWDGVFAAFSADAGVACGLTTDGTIVCKGGVGPSDSGDAEGGALGPVPPGRYIDVAVSRGDELAGWYHACALRSGGSAVCWGQDRAGETHVPSTLAAGPYRQIATGPRYSCALRTDGHVACWGDGGDAPAGRLRGIAVGASFACALDEAGSARCWGAGLRSVSDGHGGGVPPTGTFRRLFVHGQEMCGVRANGDTPCWGKTRLDE